MYKILRIVNWAENFENNRTRELKKLDWVPIPNKHDGDGYTELIEHERGMAHYGAWCMIVQVASKCDTRGTLLRDGRIEVRDSRTFMQAGSRPHDAATLARKTRGDAKIFAEAITRLVAIGWLEYVDCESTTYENPAPSCENPAGKCENPAAGCLEGKGREGKGNTPVVPKGDTQAVQAKLVLEAPEPELSREEFAREIFALYPRKDGKAEALKAILAAFKSITPIELRVKVEEFARAVATWPEDEKQFVPWCQKWMNKKRWLDDPAAWIRTQSKATLEQIEMQIATHPANPESKRYNPNCTEDQKNHLRALRIQRKDLQNGR